MAVKNDIDITIGGKTITLSGVESEEYLHEVAAYLNEKLRNFSDDAAYWRLPNDMRNVMLQLNLADDYFKEHSRVLALEAQVQDLEEHRDLSVKTIEKIQGAGCRGRDFGDQALRRGEEPRGEAHGGNGCPPAQQGGGG